ncbi:MAG TPA: DinB family protein, partial [Thermoanaerobaculia bacterium]|nr:DinB family protein [Thermoanaerobaculia bacterium]
MSELAYSSANAVSQAGAYVAALLQVLGSRDPFEVLAEMPVALRQAVAGLSPEQDATPERSGKWSVRQVVNHLADSDLVTSFRFRMILAHDAPELPGYDQDLWAERLRYQDNDLATALEDFTWYRLANLRLLRRARPEDLQRVMRHAERGEESLHHLIRLFAGHDLVHLRQIARIRQAI